METPTLNEMIQALAANVMVAREAQNAGGNDGGWTDRRKALFAKYSTIIDAYADAHVRNVEVAK